MIDKFAKRVAELRLEKNLSQTELAKILEISQTTVAKWENGERKPSVNALIDIANFFDVSTDYLLGIKDYD